MFEVKILAAFMADRKDFDMASPYVDAKTLSPMGAVMFDAISNYYKRDVTAERVDLEVLRLKLTRRFKDVPRHLDKMQTYLEEVLSSDTSKINVITELVEQRRAEVGTKLADALLAQDNERIEMLMSDYEQLTDAAILELNVEEEYTGVTLDELEEQFDSEGAWQIAPSCINEKIKGGVRPGHSIVIAARPERGKTLFAISIAAGMAKQGARVLYIGNEDPLPDLVVRLIACMSGMTEDEMFGNKQEAMRRAYNANYENVTFAGLSPGTLYEIEALVRRHEPDILIVDQMRNIRANTENNTQRLEVVAQELRNIGRRHKCVVIAMTQVGESGRDKLELNDGDIDGSNTGIPGACDVILLVGCDEDYENRNLRRVKPAKNKRGGDHDSVTVSIDPKLSRVYTYEQR